MGGVAYKILDATPDDLGALLDDVSSWRRFLPKTRDAERVGTAGDDPLVRITHGSALVQVGYTLRVHREGNVVRFWMDRLARPRHRGRVGLLPRRAHAGRPHARDLRHPHRHGRRHPARLFENRVREVALEVPDHVRDAIAERQARAGGPRASSAPSAAESRRDLW